MNTMNKKYLAAISGGPDSMALLDMYKKNIKIAIHVNYKKRNDSNNDEEIVKQYCKHHNIDFVSLNVTQKMYDDIDINNFQNAARIIRYNFFLEIAKKYNLYDIYVAHQLDDFIETALMQKSRQSKNFYYGIKKNSNYSNLIIHRPLINYSKNMLLNYCKKHKIVYAIDSTNNTDLYERNRIRKEIINKPFLFKLIWKLKFQIVNLWLKPRLNKTLSLYTKWEKNKYNTLFFNKINYAYQKYIIYYFLKNNDFEKINLQKIELIIDFIKKGEVNKKLRLKDNILLKKNKDNIQIIYVESE